MNYCDSTGKSDTPSKSVLEVKKERPLGVKVDSQPTMRSIFPVSTETNPYTSFDPSRNIEGLVKLDLTKK